jgi:hypothetical protein
MNLFFTDCTQDKHIIRSGLIVHTKLFFSCNFSVHRDIYSIGITVIEAILEELCAFCLKPCPYFLYDLKNVIDCMASKMIFSG